MKLKWLLLPFLFLASFILWLPLGLAKELAGAVIWMQKMSLKIRDYWRTL